MTDPTHLHLLLNHFPTVGFIIALGLLGGSVVTRSDDLKQAGLVVFVGIALMTIPTYVTGHAAQMVLADMPGVSQSIIDTHEGAAFVSLVLMELTGALAWYALWRRRRERVEPRALSGTLVVMSLLTLAVVTRAASIGGQIRHTEIQGAVEPTFAGPLARTVGDFVRDTPWAWTGAETVHFLGLTLLIGVVGLLALRVLGLARGLSTAAVDRLLPWGMLGFAVNTMTGMLFMAAQYSQYVTSSAFYYKLVSILAAGACIVYFTLDRSWLVRPEQEAPALSRGMAAATLGLWLIVLFWGMMLPFMGTAF